MAQTYTTQWFRVSNSDITTHDPQSLVPTNKDIRLLNAEVQWEGVETSTSNVEYATNTDSATAQAYTTTDDASNQSFEESAVSDGSEVSVTNTLPSMPSGNTFEYHVVTVRVRNDSSQQQTFEVTCDGPDQTRTQQLVVTGNAFYTDIISFELNTNYIGSNVTVTTSSQHCQMELFCQTWSYSTQTQSDTATATYPAVPDGYTFVQHTHEEFRGGTQKVDNTYTTDTVGESESITSNDTSTTVEVALTTKGKTTVTDTSNTQDPRVTRDVLGESSVTLTEGETSNWYSLSELDPDAEEFYHDIDGSGEARFRFRFDWERAYPDAIAELRIDGVDTDTVHRVALADPSDGQLVHNSIRTSVDDQVLAVDVVPPSDSDAIESHRLYHPVDGILCPRAFATI